MAAETKILPSAAGTSPGFVQISEQFTVKAAVADVWRLVSDPTQVAACIPGAVLYASEPGQPLQGTIKIKFGPTVVTFKGEVKMQYDDKVRRCTIEGRGLDQRGSSRALANGVVTLSGEVETLVTLEGAYRMTGPLEGFARTGGVHVARALIAEFATNLSALLGPGSEASPAPMAKAASLDGFRLLRHFLAGYWRQLTRQT